MYRVVITLLILGVIITAMFIGWQVAKLYEPKQPTPNIRIEKIKYTHPRSISNL